MVSFTHDGAGTPESHWRTWEHDRTAGDLQVEALFDGRLPARFLLLAAHPDDETLGAGGLLARLARDGVRCDVVVLTDGEGSHPDSPTHTPARLAEVLPAGSAVASSPRRCASRLRMRSTVTASRSRSAGLST